MNGYQSIATIKSPEFINLQPLDLNPMMSKCEIKVFYLGKNRNSTSIDKNTALIMAKTLRGAPIVGYYKPDKGDFFDHGDQVIYDGDGIHFNTLTKPYGFVSPDADVWFQEFEEYNENGEQVLRTYLMTTGYLWTGQYEEAKQVLMDGGKPHSMELDENTLQGFWSKEANDDHEFFIINDAIFSKLCILGDDVEPCFEGSSITAPNVSKQFSLDNAYKRTLYSMMKELQETLQGGKTQVENQDVQTKSTVMGTPGVEEAPAPAVEVEAPAAPVVEEAPVVEPEAAPEAAEEKVEENQAEILDNSAELPVAENEVSIENPEVDPEADFAKKEEKEDEGEKKEEGEDGEKKEEEDDDKKKGGKSYELVVEELEELQQKFATLTEDYAKLTEEVETLRQYKLTAENEQKDALIAEFTMLTDEDKQEVIEHKAEYTLDEIKSKLAVKCYDKKVTYAKVEEPAETKFTVEVQNHDDLVPEWLQAVDRYNQK